MCGEEEWDVTGGWKVNREPPLLSHEPRTCPGNCSGMKIDIKSRWTWIRWISFWYFGRWQRFITKTQWIDQYLWNLSPNIWKMTVLFITKIIYIYVESMEWFDQNRISAGLDPDAIGIPTICVIIVFIGRYHHDASSLVRWTTPQSDPKWLYFSLLDYYTWTRNMVATWFDGLRFDVNPRFCWTPSLLLEGTNFNRNSSLCWGVMSIPFVSSVTEQTVQWLKVSAAAGTACKDCMQ
jgi:hypothetical protein